MRLGYSEPDYLHVDLLDYQSIEDVTPAEIRTGVNVWFLWLSRATHFPTLELASAWALVVGGQVREVVSKHATRLL
jgi:hypothetical protein